MPVETEMLYEVWEEELTIAKSRPLSEQLLLTGDVFLSAGQMLLISNQNLT